MHFEHNNCIVNVWLDKGKIICWFLYLPFQTNSWYPNKKPSMVSSANDNIWLSVQWAMSFTYSRYKRGPKIDPCVMPHSIMQTFDLTSSNLNKFLTVCTVIHQPVFNVIPYTTGFPFFLKIIEWLITSNILLKSHMIVAINS